MNKAKLSCKWVCFLSLSSIMIGFLYFLPSILIWRELDNLNLPYEAVQLSHHSDEAYGAIARYREIYEGNFPPNDLHFNNNNPSPFGPFPIPMIIMAGFMGLFEADVNASYLFAHFIIPPILFLLFYWLGKVITGNKLWAYFMGMIGVLTPVFKYLPYAFKNINLFSDVVLKNFYPAIKTPLTDLFLARTLDPMLTYLVLLPVLTLLLLFWRRPSRGLAVSLGLVVGLMFYTYFHYWVFVSLVLGFILVYAFAARKKYPKLLPEVITVLAAVVVVTIPYWVNYFSFNSLPWSNDIANRWGITEGRRIDVVDPSPFYFDYLFYLLLAFVVYLVFYWRNSKTAVLYWIFTAAMSLIWLVQLVTGFVPQPDHWFRAISPFIFIILFHSFYELVRDAKIVRGMAVILMILCFFLVTKKINNVLVFLNSPPAILKEYSFSRSVTDSWNWMNDNLPFEPVVVSPSFVTSIYLNNHTSARPFLAVGVNSGEANSVLEERFLETYKFFGVDPDFLAKIMKADPVELCDNVCEEKDFHRAQNLLKNMRNLYGQYYKRGQEGENKTVFRYIFESHAGKLLKIYNGSSVDIKTLGGDYIYYGPWEKQLVNPKTLTFHDLKIEYKNTNVEIYDFLK
ncbi:MAG: hypothetical protein WAP55_02270 [Minisyncoccia bacterium]